MTCTREQLSKSTSDSEETSRQLAALERVVASLRHDIAVNDELHSRQLDDLKLHETQLEDTRRSLQLAVEAAEATASQLQTMLNEGGTIAGLLA